ncbi:MAG TPA: fumarylacetoacetate hydrolase family protein, partial [Roseiflexaceae bacterium]|nr:fumarylacetoacetate hydrolase family protein [Roseiflexaceae bacterium]
MRFISFRYIDHFPRAGVLLGDTVIDLAAAAPLAFEDLDQPRWELLDILRGAPDGSGIEGAIEIAAAALDQLGVADITEFVELQGSGAIVIGGAEVLLPLDEGSL